MTETFETLIERLKLQVERYKLELDQAHQQIRVLQQSNANLHERLTLQRVNDISMATKKTTESQWNAPVVTELGKKTKLTQTQTLPSPQALLKQWYDRYPNVFFRAHTKPLKIGIHEELVNAEPWPAKLIRRALAHYVNLPRYLKSLRIGIDRINLSGEKDGIVNEDDSRYAEQRLMHLQAQRKAREQQINQLRLTQKLAQLNAAFNEKN